MTDPNGPILNYQRRPPVGATLGNAYSAYFVPCAVVTLLFLATTMLLEGSLGEPPIQGICVLVVMPLFYPLLGLLGILLAWRLRFGTAPTADLNLRIVRFGGAASPVLCQGAYEILERLSPNTLETTETGWLTLIVLATPVLLGFVTAFYASRART